MIGDEMYKWAVDLFPINRSLTGQGVRDTLKYISKLLPNFKIESVKSGSVAFDWTVPREWEIKEAFISDLDGNRIIDFANNNLHVVGYSTPVDKIVTRDELFENLYSIPEKPDWIPYVTSYYKERWGFCISESQKKMLNDDRYRVYIDSRHFDGVLNYGELVIPGSSQEEVLISTYICHPSMANNELSGPVVSTALARELSEVGTLKYTYRFLFLPETIGSIVYISKHLKNLKENVIAGFVVTCIGDERTYSYVPSRKGNTISDQVALNVLKFTDREFNKYTWLDRGSDERQFCAPGVDLPICSMMRSKYGEYPEYHTSADDLSLISPKGLKGGFDILKKAIQIIEENDVLKVRVFCEPQMGKRGLYPTISKTGSTQGDVSTMMDFISLCDGTRSLIQIAEFLDVDATRLIPIKEDLIKAGLLNVKQIQLG